MAQDRSNKTKVERLRRLKTPAAEQRRVKVLQFLQTKVWPSIPKKALGRRLTREEEDAILGNGPSGVADAAATTHR